MSKDLENLKSIVARLRSPEGCPWDREQTHASMKSGLIEEAYEVIEAIDKKDDVHFKEELGDFLLQVVMHCQIASEEGRFNLDQVAAVVSEKLIRRHPHVFGENKLGDSEAVLVQWDQIKRAERGDSAHASVLEGVSKALPALMRAEKVQKRAARVGFDWQKAHDVVEKIREEVVEVEAELLAENDEKLEEEIGDLFFAVVNLARKAKIDSELALQQATNKFTTRFQQVEATMRERGLSMEKSSLEELDAIWDEVKAAE
jgi:MazG family protein